MEIFTKILQRFNNRGINMFKEYKLDENIIQNTDILKLIEKSRDPKVSGVELSKIHMELGDIIGKGLSQDISIDTDNTTIITIMRAGLFFAYSIWEHFPQAPFLPITKAEDLDKYDMYLENRDVIIIDTVINSGKTINPIIQKLEKNNNISIALNVIPAKTVPIFDKYNVHAIRSSLHSYKGTKGNDTGNRLFNTTDII